MLEFYLHKATNLPMPLNCKAEICKEMIEVHTCICEKKKQTLKTQ